MGLESLTAKEFKKFKPIIDFLAKFDLSIEDLVELKHIKEKLNNANLETSKKDEELKKQKEQNELNAKLSKQLTANEIMEMFAQDGEREGFYPNGRRS